MRKLSGSEAVAADDAVRVAMVRTEPSLNTKATPAARRRRREGEESDLHLGQEAQASASVSEPLTQQLAMPDLGPETQLQVFAVQDGSGGPVTTGYDGTGYLLAQAGGGPGPVASSAASGAGSSASTAASTSTAGSAAGASATAGGVVGSVGAALAAAPMMALVGGLVAVAAAAGGAGSGSGSASPGGTTAEATNAFRKRVVDGPIEGATLYLDLDGDGVIDAGEPELSPTDAQGYVTVNLTNSQLGFGLLARGGTDIETNKPFSGVLAAPAGSSVINPLTTLVAALMEGGNKTLSEAKAAVVSALGLTAG
ncbi:MAG: hypothetical protein FJY42_15365, partial [Betaproteobacteria bacterium]|nr:hypothetical protein [Betaproteobacteria bacterium]